MIKTIRNSSEWTFLEPPCETITHAMENSEIICNALPTHAWISLSNFCNLSCKHCRRNYGAQRQLGGETDISDVLYARLREEIIPNLHSLILGGNNLSEITRAVRFSEIIEWLANVEKKPINLSIQTNGSQIDDKTLLNLISMNTVFNISIEGGTSKTTKAIRGISLEKISETISKINKLRKTKKSTARIVLSFTAMKSNINEIYDLLEFAEIFGVDEVSVMYLLPATKKWNDESLVHCPDTSNKIIGEALSLSESWKVKLIAPLIKDLVDQPCQKPWHSISINGDGEVRFCCLDGSPIIGNLSNNNFVDLWNGPLAQRVRSEVNTEYAPSECSFCVIRNMPYVSLSSLKKNLVV